MEYLVLILQTIIGLLIIGVVAHIIFIIISYLKSTPLCNTYQTLKKKL